jgi:heme/copper-type cytochrome/quinol oxidase subunit 3
MAQSRVEQSLSRQQTQALKNKRAGLFVFQLSWILAFVCLIMVNFWIRSREVAWPPAGVQLERIIPTLMTLILIASSVFIRRGVRAVKAEGVPQFRSDWRLALGMGMVFVLGMAFEFATAPGSGQFRDIYRVMIGFHALHAVAIGYYLIYVYQHSRDYGPTNFWPAEGGAGLWDFVTVAWILFYIVLYVI